VDTDDWPEIGEKRREETRGVQKRRGDGTEC
jgi:hypothetical protein